MKNLNRKFHNPDIRQVKSMDLLSLKIDLKLSVNIPIKIINPMIIIQKIKNQISHIKVPFNPKSKTAKDVVYTLNYKTVTTFPLWRESIENKSRQFNNT